jgi:NAD(P)-dependent dehydrogenase (short-subunit alcohol dehydrogenase family)
VHFFYDSMCAPCAELNWTKRRQTADLTGRVALLTGARVKIGYQASIKLLRGGARVIATTRFPRDAARRYAREPDFADWGERLAIYGLDLRHTPSVETFCREILARYDRLDVIINNACQTVRRPVGFYDHLMQGETDPAASLPRAERRLLEDHERLSGTTALATRRLLVDAARARLEAIAKQGDGFALAEVDLSIRGEGEILGTRQHGLPRFRVADLPEDIGLLVSARDELAPLIREQGSLDSPQLALIAEAARRRFGDELDPLAA